MLFGSFGRRWRVGTIAVLVLIGTLSVPTAAAATSRATTSKVTSRAFTCSGTLADLGTLRVTGSLSTSNVPYQLAVTHNGAALSTRRAPAVLLGTSLEHQGYRQWDITGPDANADLYYLDLPPVLPGRGGFFDADLEILYNGGIDGSNVISMFDCTITGGSLLLSFPLSPRHFICSGNDAEVARTVTGRLIPLNAPYAVTVANTRTGVFDSLRPSFATLLGFSALHPGYLEWDITGANTNTDLYRLSLPPVLPARGGYFDANLEILYNAGINGSVQIPMFDCTIG